MCFVYRCRGNEIGTLYYWVDRKTLNLAHRWNYFLQWIYYGQCRPTSSLESHQTPIIVQAYLRLWILLFIPATLATCFSCFFQKGNNTQPIWIACKYVYLRRSHELVYLEILKCKPLLSTTPQRKVSSFRNERVSHHLMKSLSISVGSMSIPAIL